MQYLFYQGGISDQGVRNVQAILTGAHQAGEQNVTICLSSHGGDVSAGLGLYNFIGMLPMNINTHAAGLCNSIAATVLLAGKRRTASPLSAFTTHASTYTTGALIGQLAPDTALIAQPFKDKLNWTDNDVTNRFSATDFRFSPAEALGYGLIHDVQDLVLAPGETMIPVAVP